MKWHLGMITTDILKICEKWGANIFGETLRRTGVSRHNEIYQIVQRMERMPILEKILIAFESCEWMIYVGLFVNNIFALWEQSAFAQPPTGKNNFVSQKFDFFMIRTLMY